MKNSILKSIRNLALMFLLSGFTLTSFAQTTHEVSVTNNVFTPKDITINVGDVVKWTNSQGFHNVNGKKSTYPDNPESFGNITGTNWTYSYTFNAEGKYDYQCDPHV